MVASSERIEWKSGGNGCPEFDEVVEWTEGWRSFGKCLSGLQRLL